LVAGSGSLEPLRAMVDSPTGRPRSLSVEAFLVAAQLNGLRRGHTAKIADIARILNSFSASQLETLGVRSWVPKESYRRTDRLFNKLATALDRGGDLDRDRFAASLVDASLTEVPATSTSAALDATDVETWGRLHWPRTGSETDSKAPRVLWEDEDGRPVRTLDPDARDGHRSATNSRKAGQFTGYYLHNIVQVRDVRHSDGREGVVFGPDVPAVVTGFALTPAAAPLEGAVVPILEEMNREERRVHDLLMDRGYSQLSDTGLHHPLRHAGMELIFQPKGPHQRLRTPFSPYAVLIDGQLFSTLMPKRLQTELPWAPYGATEADTLAFEQAYNERSRWRFQLHAGPDTEGTTRWKCPFHAGLLRSRQLPFTMRRSRAVPLVEIPEGAKCCDGTISVSAADLPFRQKLTPGTTAWRKSYRRRNVVEGVNAMLKGGFVNIQQKFFRVFRLTKLTFLLAFTIAGYNIETIRSFNARKLAEAESAEAAKKRRRKRRKAPGASSSMARRWNPDPTLRQTDANRLNQHPLHQGRHQHDLMAPFGFARTPIDPLTRDLMRQMSSRSGSGPPRGCRCHF
jgi:hypothetical protein